MIYVSTACFKYKTLYKLFKEIKKKIIKEKYFNYKIHNYFPPKKKPFVFNLASQDFQINNKSLKMAIDNIILASKLNSTTYSLHAGYMFDPFFFELGKKIEKHNIYNKKNSINTFIKNVNNLSKIASRFKINIMIENNVINKINYKTFNHNPLLMCDINETKKIFKYLPKNITLLVDVAHLKVSSNTLNFDKSKYLRSLSNIIGGYHLSDNNGLIDSNRPFTKKSWFWNFLNTNLNYYSIEVYNESILKIKEQLKIANEKINK